MIVIIFNSLFNRTQTDTYFNHFSISLINFEVYIVFKYFIVLNVITNILYTILQLFLVKFRFIIVNVRNFLINSINIPNVTSFLWLFARMTTSFFIRSTNYYLFPYRLRETILWWRNWYNLIILSIYLYRLIFMKTL